VSEEAHVVKLIIDASGSKVELAQWEESLKKAGETADRTMNQSINGWKRVQAANDPIFAAQVKAQAEIDKAFFAGTRAVALGITTQEKFGAEMLKTAARMDATVVAAQKATNAHTVLGKATSGLQGQMALLAGGAGPISTFLAGIGPFGFAAAIGLTLVEGALHHVNEEATRMGQKSIEVRKFADVTGLTIEQIGSLKRAGAEFGVDGDSITTSFERLTGSLTDVRRASGPLFDDIQRVNGGLAIELTQTTTTAQGINVLAKAYHAAGDEAQKASIARAVFGRGGLANGPVLDTIANAGGIENLSNKTKELNDSTSAEVKLWAELQAKIDETNKRGKNILASIFTEEGLRAQLAVAEYMERIARAAKDLAAQREGLSWMQNFFTELARQSDAAGDGSVIEEITPRFAANQRLMKGLSNGKEIGDKVGLDGKDIKPWQDLSDAFKGVKTDAEKTAIALKEAQDAAASDSKITRELLGLLGSAATIEERRISRIKDLTSALLDHKIAEEDYKRAVGAANLDATIQKESERISQLGELATVSELVKQKQDLLNKAIQQGVNFSPTEIKQMQERNKLLAQSSKLEDQLQFERSQIFKSPVEQNIDQMLRSRGIPADSDFAKANANYMRMTDSLRQIRDTATDSLSGFLKDLAHGVSFMDAMANEAKRAGDALIDAGAKALVNQGLGALGGSTSIDAASAAGGASLVAAATTVASLIIDACATGAGLLAGGGAASATANAAGGAVAGSATATGGAVGGAALAQGGAAAGAVMCGPIALFAAAAVLITVANSITKAAANDNEQKRNVKRKAA
jgi:hypothetical protein